MYLYVISYNYFNSRVMFMKQKNSLVVVLIFIVIIAFCFLICGVILYIRTNNNNKIEKVDNIITNKFFNKNTLNIDFVKSTGRAMLLYNVVYGDESSLRHKPDSEIYDSYKLDRYAPDIDKYSSIVEKNFSDKLVYTASANIYGNIDYKIKPWYFYSYSNDLNDFIEKILEYINFDVSNMSNNEYNAYEYRARAIALKIMNDHLSNYDNKNEIINYELKFDNNNPNKNSLYDLYLNLIGSTSKYLSNESNQNKRISVYLNEALNEGLIDKNNFLNN